MGIRSHGHFGRWGGFMSEFWCMVFIECMSFEQGLEARVLPSDMAEVIADEESFGDGGALS